MNKHKLLIVLPILSLAWFAGTIFLAGLSYPNYSHVSQFMSELGATGSPHGVYVNYFGFIPTELLLLSFVLICSSLLPRTKKSVAGLILIGVYGVTLGVAAVFPCDFECSPVEPTFSHNVHMASAFPGYLCAIIAIFLLSSEPILDRHSKSFKLIGYSMAAIALFVFVSLDPGSSFVGAYQRTLELLIYAWFIYFAYSLRSALGEESS